MNHEQSSEENAAQLWAELFGNFYTDADLPEQIRQDPGLIAISTSDDVRLCPGKQFALDENGNPVLVDAVKRGWQMLREFAVVQGGHDEWDAASAFVSSWFDELNDPNLGEVGHMQVYERMFAEIKRWALWNDIDVGLPLQKRLEP